METAQRNLLAFIKSTAFPMTPKQILEGQKLMARLEVVSNPVPLED